MLTPRAIAIDPSDNVFVADQNDRVQKFNSSGVFHFKFATGGSSAGAVSRHAVSNEKRLPMIQVSLNSEWALSK